MSDFEDKKDESMVDNSTVEENGDKKPKKHSNAKTAIGFLLGFVVFCMAVMIATGGWNPFKNYSADEKAVEIAGNSDKKEKKIAKNIFRELDTVSEADNGLEVEKYDSGGCLKQVKNVSGAYQYYYDLNFEIYYMKNEDYAKEKFASLKGGVKPTGYNETHEFKNGQVHIIDREGWFFYTIQNGSVVYNAWGGEYTTLDKQQKFFDDFEIDFKLPTSEMTKQ